MSEVELLSQDNILDSLLGSMDPLIDDSSTFPETNNYFQQNPDFIQVVTDSGHSNYNELTNSVNFDNYFETKNHSVHIPSPNQSDSSHSTPSHPSSPENFSPVYYGHQPSSSPPPSNQYMNQHFVNDNESKPISVEQILSDVLDPSFSSNFLQNSPNSQTQSPQSSSPFSPNFNNQDSPLEFEDLENEKIVEILEDVGISMKKRKRESPENLPITLPRETLLDLSSEEFAIYAKKLNSMKRLTTQEKKELRRQMRLIKNREYAQQSRQKKKTYVSELEGQITQLVEENNKLKHKLVILATELKNVKSKSNQNVNTNPSHSAHHNLNCQTNTHPNNMVLKNQSHIQPEIQTSSHLPQWTNTSSLYSKNQDSGVRNSTSIPKTYLFIVLFAFVLMFVPPLPGSENRFSSTSSYPYESNTGRLLFSFEENWWKYTQEKLYSLFYFLVKLPTIFIPGDPFIELKDNLDEKSNCYNNSTSLFSYYFSFLVSDDFNQTCQNPNHNHSAPSIPPSPQVSTTGSKEHESNDCTNHRCDL